MATPAEFLHPILHSIESTVIKLKEEYPSLNDKDVERCYGKLKDFYRKKTFNKPCDEPEANTTKENDLIDEILNILDFREEEQLDDHLVNSADYTNGGNPFINIYQVYVVSFNNLVKSAKSWRKDKNRPSYLAHIKEHLV